MFQAGDGESLRIGYGIRYVLREILDRSEPLVIASLVVGIQKSKSTTNYCNTQS
jgi:hypothetical protein